MTNTSNYPPLSDTTAWSERLKAKYRSYPRSVLCLFLLLAYPAWVIYTLGEHFNAIADVVAEPRIK